MNEIEKHLLYRIGQACWWALQSERRREAIDGSYRAQHDVWKGLSDALEDMKGTLNEEEEE